MRRRPTWSTAVCGSEEHRPGLFRPHLFGFWSAFLANSDEPSLLDTRPMLQILRELVAFDRLNSGDVRLTILIIDAETREDVIFDTQHAPIGPEHLCASASFPVLFQPVEIDGRWLVDGGMSANLPLRMALSKPPARHTLCVALDLVSRRGEHPRSIGAAAERLQDLVFTNQSRQAILSLQREYQLRRMAAGQEPASEAAVRLLHLLISKATLQPCQIAGVATISASSSSVCPQCRVGHVRAIPQGLPE